jgi:protein-tyrosine phosphatase
MRRFNFKAVYNCRDIGGFLTQSNQIVRNNVFLRSDNLTDLQEDEMEFLQTYGVQAVIDFRHQNEIDHAPDPFVNHPNVDYYNIAILDHAQFTLEDLNRIKLSDLYISMSENKAFIKQVFDTFAKYDKAVLYHCTAGKDRTGVITALLYKLVGVPDIDIIADYEVSFTYLVPKYVGRDENVSEMYQDLFSSRPETMSTFLNYLNYKYPNIMDYFISRDISMETIDIIKRKLLGA